MTSPKYNEIYLGPITANIDWVAGGNFDGYLIQKSLKFIELNNEVVLRIRVINQSRYDGQLVNEQINGTYQFTDKDTVTCQIGNLKIRGKILGDNSDHIAFSYFEPDSKAQETECFNLELQ